MSLECNKQEELEEKPKYSQWIILPLVIEHAGKTIATTASRQGQMILVPGKVISYDISDGRESSLECSGLTDNAIPCPVALDDTVNHDWLRGFSLQHDV